MVYVTVCRRFRQDFGFCLLHPATCSSVIIYNYKKPKNAMQYRQWNRNQPLVYSQDSAVAMPDSSVKSCSRWHRAKGLWHTAHCAHPEVLHVWVGTLKLSISYPFFSLCFGTKPSRGFCHQRCRRLSKHGNSRRLKINQCWSLPMFVAVLQLAAVLQTAVVHGVLTYKGFKNVLLSSSGSTAGCDLSSPTARKQSFFIFCSSVKTILPRNL